MDIDPPSNGNNNNNTTTTTTGTTLNSSLPSSYNPHQFTESLKLEHQFLRVPFEHFKKTIRANHRFLEKEMFAVISGVNSAASADLSRDDAVNHLNSLIFRLQGLKRKLEEGNRAEQIQAQRCRVRVDHLESAYAEDMSEWNNTRLNRILVDYMLRMSYFETAVKLAECSNIQDLVDIDIFQEAKMVIDALQNKDVSPALAWCAENKSRLKKSKSKLEFQLRLQEFIELVRAENSLGAIAYARKYLAPWGATHMKELQRVIATLAFKRCTEYATYKVLFEAKQWDILVDQFRQEFCKLYGMTLEPLLNIYLQAGLSALKTPYCYEDDCTKEDPLSQESFRTLALPLPYSKQHHSKLVCYITKEIMDTENPPQVLPNGYVYSTKALQEMAKKNNGRITCPRTGFVCSYSELIKAYIS
ncbi:putative transcription factor interactor and regulator LisH family [Lupinus albus]|uniref:Putative transcription factor interactor and regulator LisH family n=1 Tax=Lupinus albus TaxID=3870 RepID=A0A6A4NPD4_LUPAL|nr:putative transcription factor interactor and regulator LisH family [Lupinus albus]